MANNKRNVIHYYPWYIKDWLLNESRLTFTLAERGLFRDLLDQMYDQGSLPKDKIALMRIAACDEEEFELSWPRVSAKFIERDGRLYNSRCDSVMEYLDVHREKLSDRGRAAAQAKQTKKLLKHTASGAHPNGRSTQLNQSKPYSETTTTTPPSSSSSLQLPTQPSANRTKNRPTTTRPLPTNPEPDPEPDPEAPAATGQRAKNPQKSATEPAKNKPKTARSATPDEVGIWMHDLVQNSNLLWPPPDRSIATKVHDLLINLPYSEAAAVFFRLFTAGKKPARSYGWFVAAIGAEIGGIAAVPRRPGIRPGFAPVEAPEVEKNPESPLCHLCRDRGYHRLAEDAKDTEWSIGALRSAVGAKEATLCGCVAGQSMKELLSVDMPPKTRAAGAA